MRCDGGAALVQVQRGGPFPHSDRFFAKMKVRPATVLMRPCAFHRCFSMQHKTGCMGMPLPPGATPPRPRASRAREPLATANSAPSRNNKPTESEHIAPSCRALRAPPAGGQAPPPHCSCACPTSPKRRARRTCGASSPPSTPRRGPSPRADVRTQHDSPPPSPQSPVGSAHRFSIRNSVGSAGCRTPLTFDTLKPLRILTIETRCLMWILDTPNPRTLADTSRGRARRSRVYGETQVAASLAGPDEPGVGHVTLPIDLAPWALELRCARGGEAPCCICSLMQAPIQTPV
jgi:hypothetical protein